MGRSRSKAKQETFGVVVLAFSMGGRSWISWVWEPFRWLYILSKALLKAEQK